MKDRIRRLFSLFVTLLAAVQLFVPQPVFAEKQYVKEQIYFEDFNGVSAETLAAWNRVYDHDTAEKGQWYVNSSTTAILENHTGEDDRALSMNGHVNGQNNFYYFKLPGDIAEDGIDKYEITFDYYANGSWCDWFYLRNAAGSAGMNMNYSSGWRTVSMTVDLTDHSWLVGNSAATDANLPSVLDGSELTLAIRLHGNAAAGNRIRVDNFTVYKLSESLSYDIYDETVSLYDQSGVRQEDPGRVDIKLGRITVDFGEEELDGSTVTRESVSLDGDVEYETSYENGSLSLEIMTRSLDFDREYRLTLDGLKLTNGTIVNKKEFFFRTMKNETVVSDEAYIEYEDFEDWTNETCATHYNDSFIASGGFRTWTTTGIAVGKDGGKALTPMFGTRQSARSLEYYFVPKLQNDTFLIEFDYYPGAVDNYSEIKFGIYRGKDGTGTTVLSSEAMTSFSGEWGHVRLEVQPAKSKWSVVLTDGSGDPVYENSAGTWADSDIRMLGWNVSVTDVQRLAQDENLPKIDNLTVNAVYTSEPVLSKKSFKVFEGESEQSLTAVSPASDQLVIDFGQRMLPEDMSAEKVYLTEKDDPSVRIATVNKYSGGKYEMSPVDYLKPGSSYTVHVEKCRNTGGMEMAEPCAFDFTVGQGTVEAACDRITQNGAEVMSAAGLSKGDALLGVRYKNSTGKAYVLHYIIAFYMADEMVSCAYRTATLPEYATGQITDIPVTVPEVSAPYNEVDIITWDSFNGMLPIAKALVLR